jgi:hypothetical protein
MALCKKGPHQIQPHFQQKILIKKMPTFRIYVVSPPCLHDRPLPRFVERGNDSPQPQWQSQYGTGRIAG